MYILKHCCDVIHLFQQSKIHLSNICKLLKIRPLPCSVFSSVILQIRTVSGKSTIKFSVLFTIYVSNTFVKKKKNSFQPKRVSKLSDFFSHRTVFGIYPLHIMMKCRRGKFIELNGFTLCTTILFIYIFNSQRYHESVYF